MKKIFLDTNIILDLLIREEYKSQIRELISRSADYDLYISYLTVANAAYIMRKYPKAELKSNLQLIHLTQLAAQQCRLCRCRRHSESGASPAWRASVPLKYNRTQVADPLRLCAFAPLCEIRKVVSFQLLDWSDLSDVSDLSENR